MPTSKTWLIAGLGNPGPDYADTLHNLGFLTVDRLADRHGIRVTRKEANALVGLGEIKGSPAVLVKPQTYMNLSGVSVKMLLDRYELGPDGLLLIYDELAIPWRTLRIRPKGSSAGHNGVKSVIACLGTQDFARIRLGIQPDHPIGDPANYVLARFSRGVRAELDEALDQAASAAETVIAEGVEKAMAAYNRRAQGVTEEEK